MRHVIFDTNSLLLPFHFKVDVFTEAERLMQFPHELCVVEETVGELEKVMLSAQKLTDRQAAKLGLLLLKQKSLKRLRGFLREATADAAILKRTRKDDVVVTQDKALKALLKKKGVAVLILRQKSHLAFG